MLYTVFMVFLLPETLVKTAGSRGLGRLLKILNNRAGGANNEYQGGFCGPGTGFCGPGSGLVVIKVVASTFITTKPSPEPQQLVFRTTKTTPVLVISPPRYDYRVS